MNKKLNGIAGLAVLAAIIGAANLILSNLPLRLDMTGEKLYTLTKGSKAVLAKLEQDVTLKYYFSASSAEMPMQLKTYAQQVQNLLKEYELAGKGHVTLEAYDPKPDSDAEEYIAYLEKEVEAQKTRRLEAMKALRQQSETIARLIREKEIDRIKLSHAAGAISMITWRELNV